MTVIPTELAERRPAEIVVVERRSDQDFAGPFPVVPFDRETIARFVESEIGRRQPRPPTRGEVVFLRVGAVLLILAAVAVLVLGLLPVGWPR